MTSQASTPAGKIRNIAFKRTNPRDDLVADFIAIAAKPGDKTVQLGRSEFGADLLRSGTFHEMIAPVSDVEAMQVTCENRAISADRLRSFNAARPNARVDLALIGSDLSFPMLAGNWRRIAGRLKLGGLLILQDADSDSGARLADALMTDKTWSLEEMIGGNVAVFRKISPHCDETGRARLGEVASPARRPGGLKEGFVAGVMRTIFGRRPDAVLQARIDRFR